MNNFITAEEARKNVEMCYSLVAESPLVDINTKRLFILWEKSGKDCDY